MTLAPANSDLCSCCTHTHTYIYSSNTMFDLFLTEYIYIYIAPWLNMPETKKKLNGKKVMMYCTGGIRCERATALLNDMTAVDPSFKTQGVYELRGGVDRYLKTFPDGGLWKGKNYVFDRRLVQVPENKTIEKLNADIESKCVVCRKLWDEYRGKYKCAMRECGVPVIVCIDCVQDTETPLNIKSLQCELCRENYKAPRARPNLKSIKKQVFLIIKTCRHEAWGNRCKGRMTKWASQQGNQQDTPEGLNGLKPERMVKRHADMQT